MFFIRYLGTAMAFVNCPPLFRLFVSSTLGLGMWFNMSLARIRIIYSY